jgi:CRP/FNR family cyclic AMP-dependent transcriptional regulator
VGRKRVAGSGLTVPGEQVCANGSPAPIDTVAFLTSAGRISRFPRGAILYAQGDRADKLFYVQDGAVKLSVVSAAGKEAVVAVLGPGEFFGEDCLTVQTKRMGSVKAITPVTVLVVGKRKMTRLLHERQAMSDWFLAYVLTRKIRIEEDLIDQLFNSSEKRLARTLLLLARYGKQDKTHHVIPKLSQEVLAEMVGTTRSRVNFFMNKFRKLGLIEYNGGLKIHGSLLSVVLLD